jgi:hypothetical protein
MSDKGKYKCGFYSLFVFLAFVATSPVLVSCTPKTRTIEGTVFIVTNSSDNIKLGNVDVSFRDNNAVDQFLSEFLPKETRTLDALRKDILAGKKTEDDLSLKVSSLRADMEKNKASLDEKKKQITEQDPEDVQDSKVESLLKEKEDLEDEISKTKDKITYYNTSFTNQIDEVSLRLASLEQIMWKENCKLRASTDPVPEIPEIPVLRERKAEMNQEKNLNIRALTEKKSSDSEKLRQLNILIGKRQKDFSLAQKEVEKIRNEAAKKRNELAKDIDVLDNNIKKQEDDLSALTGLLDLATNGHSKLVTTLDTFDDSFQERIFKELPPSTLSATTDADGKYSIEIPYEGKFTVSVFSERLVAGSKVEKYYWFVHLPERDRAKDKFFGLFFIPFKPIASEKFNLTPSNRIGTPDPHCAVKLLQPD